MKSLKINKGVIRLAINDDPGNVLEFNPSDSLFMKKYMQLLKGFWDKLKELEIEEQKITSNEKLNEMGLPENMERQLEILEKTCIYVREQIDYVFGEGISQRLFGDVLSIEVYKQLFEGISPYIQETRELKTAKYTNKRDVVTKRKAVMR